MMGWHGRDVLYGLNVTARRGAVPPGPEYPVAVRRLLVGLLCLSACGSPTTPEGLPELTGEYVATLTAQFTSVPGGVQTSGVPCGATVVVSRQTGDAFEGTYDRGFPCARATYPLRGTVQRSGALVADIAGGDANFQGFDQCGYVSGDQRWSGQANGDELTLRIDVVLSCAVAGSQRTVATISARRGR